MYSYIKFLSVKLKGRDLGNVVQVQVTLRLMVSQSVSKSWCRAPSGSHDQIFITVGQLRPNERPGLPLYMLLALASALGMQTQKGE
jgi:hypothetical protein